MRRRASTTPVPDWTRESLSRLLTVQELADLLQVPIKTIYTWRYKRIGPPAVPLGRYLRFRAEDVAAWIEERADPPPSDARRSATRSGPSGDQIWGTWSALPPATYGPKSVTGRR